MPNRGNDRDHLVDRLQQGGHGDLLRAVGTGQASAYGASVAAKLRSRKPGGVDIANRRQRLLKSRLRALGADEKLTGEQIQELWLFGPGAQGSAFRNAKAARAAWKRSRAFFMTGAGVGSRPWGWWEFECPFAPYHPGPGEEAALLFALDALGVSEERELLPMWREKYAHACELRGFTAVRDYLDSAILPRTLFFQWNVERRRCREQVRKLEAEATGTAV